MTERASSAPAFAWYGRDGERYVTRGADVFHGAGGWYARCGRKVRGPISCMDNAMIAAERMLAENPPLVMGRVST